jgi:dTMP kinase
MRIAGWGARGYTYQIHMPARGAFIAIEGIDGSGKRTQIELLGHALDRRGIRYACFSFPRYDSSFGQLAASYLNGDFGPLERVDPHFSALLFAGDRFESKGELETELAKGKVVLADRYIGSNLAHQTARVGPQRREEFSSWLKRLEYGIYGLPAEDLVIYLRLPTVKAQELIGRKGAREYTKLSRDLQEADARHLEQAGLVYDRLATEANWRTIECCEGPQAKLRTPDAIHAEVLAAIETLLPAVPARA